MVSKIHNVSPENDKVSKKAGKQPQSVKSEQKVLSACEKLDAYGIDAICFDILHPKPMHQIADEIGVSQGSLIAWIGKTPERSARAKEARTQTAQMWDEKATRVVEEAGNNFELAKARELAQHYRWRASKIAPRDYGDKVAIGGASDLPAVQTESVLDVSNLPTEVLAQLMKAKSEADAS